VKWLLLILLLSIHSAGFCQWVEFQACGLINVENAGYDRFSGPATHIKGFMVWAPAVTHVTSYMPVIVEKSKVECVNLWIGKGSLLVVGSQGDVMKKLRAANCKRNRIEGK